MRDYIFTDSSLVDKCSPIENSPLRDAAEMKKLPSGGSATVNAKKSVYLTICFIADNTCSATGASRLPQVQAVPRASGRQQKIARCAVELFLEGGDKC